MTQAIWSNYISRDFTPLQYISFLKKCNYEEAIIIVHGITAEVHHQKAFAEKCERQADVFLPILRGYDQSSKRGDIDFIGQYDYDLFDFVHHIENKGYKKITLIGHSMGCANILRLMKKNSETASEYIFIAPFFHPRLPVYHDEATEQSNDRTDVDYTVYDKKVMLLMTLYKMNIKRFNNRQVAEIPDEFHHSGRLPLSFRLLVSRFLEKIPSDLFEGINNRVSIYVGDQDEVIQHEKLQKWTKNKWGIDIEIIKGTDHNHILRHPDFHQMLEKNRRL